MIRLKSVAQWFILVGILLLLPEESRLALFDTRPGDWYGELVLDYGQGAVVVAKNAGYASLDLALTGDVHGFVLQEHADVALAESSSDLILPRSIGVFHAAEDGNSLMSKRIVRGTHDRYFGPSPLAILTRAELWSSYWLGATIMGAFLILGFLLARLHSDDGLGRSDK